MNGATVVRGKKGDIAMIFRHTLAVDGVKFFTSEDNPFQIGIHARKKGVVLAPHVHLMEKPLTITSIQELLFISSGKIRVTLYETDGTKIEAVILTTGDAILLMNGGHGVDILEDSKIFELKQGPYPGTTHAKLYFDAGHAK
jgi:hypothetical protein